MVSDEGGCDIMIAHQGFIKCILVFYANTHATPHTEHRDKLHGTLATFDAVDRRIKGE